ncbi:ionotropic receptor 84a isoform X2 [Haematobia irritans]|uniref:ionotropic receptor 84a isoform X2 n=1 Tax=Haematobia irritans TaxID=7368 RepID=UPI003F4F9672
MVLPLSKAFAAIIRLNIGIIITSVAVTQATMQWQPFIGSCEIQAFRDHLDRQYLRNVIILYDERKTHQGNASLTKIRSPGITQQEQSAGTGDWEDFTNYYFLKFFNMENSNEQDFKELLHKYYPRTAFLLALSPGNVDHLRILLLASNNGLFNYSMSWFVFMQDNENEQHLANIHQTFGPLNIELNADITVAYKRDNCKFDLYDVHKVCYKCGSPLVMEYKGNWSPAYGLDLQEIFKHSFVSRRNNWKNESVNVGTALLNYSPDLQMSMVEYLEDSKRYLENDLMMRKAYQLIQMVQGVYNFTFRLKFSDGWGIPLNNTWTGVMGLVVRDEVEFSVAPLRFTSERIRQVVYSQVVHVERVRFLFRHPKRSSIRNIFFEPLATTVWWCVFALTVITGILLAIHVYAEYRWYWKVQLAKGEEPPQHDIEPDVDFIVFTTLETIFMQGPTPEHFNANSTRLLLTSVSAFTIILMQFYGAFVVSSLLSEAPRSITNLPALYGSNLEIGMEDIPYNYEFFASTSSPVVRNIYNNRICKKGTRNIVSLEEGADRIGQGGFAFHASLNRIYRILAVSPKRMKVLRANL